MNFFCTKSEMEQYIAQMGLDENIVIKADINAALREAWETFHIEG